LHYYAPILITEIHLCTRVPSQSSSCSLCLVICGAASALGKEVSVKSCGFQTIPPYISAPVCTLATSARPAPYCWAGPPVSPRDTKAGFPGGAETPLNMPPATRASLAGTRRRVRAPATNRPKAHFPHPGRGGRQTSEGGGWGRAPGTLAAPPPGERLGQRPWLQLEGRGGPERSFPLTQRQRSRRSPPAKGPRKLQQGYRGTLGSVR
jgi:hypothetical protein